MRIAFIGDVHLGEGSSLGRTDPKTGMSQRLTDFLSTLDQIVNYIIDHCEIAVFVGDVFHTRQPTSIQQTEFVQRLTDLTSSGIKVYIIPGNHDLIRGYGDRVVHTMSYLEEIYLPLVKVYSESGFILQDQFAIGFIPYMNKERLGIKDYTNASELYYEKHVKPIIDGMKDFNGPKILVGHQTIQGTALSSGQKTDLYLLNELTVPQHLFKGFNLVVYGHIHKPQILRQNPLIVVPGSIDRGNFGEANDPKSFPVFNTEDYSLEIIPLNVRPFYDLKIDVRESLDPTSRVIDELKKLDLKGSMCKVTIQIKRTDLPLINDSQIKEAAKEADTFTFQQKVEHDKKRSRNTTINETLTPYKALEEYLKDKPEITDIMPDILLAAENIMKETIK